MGAVTYPHEDVVRFVTGRFTPVAFDMADRSPETRDVLRRYRLLWSPGYVVLDHEGTELRRFLGYQPPADWMAELTLALGKTYLLHRQIDEAYEAFRAVGDGNSPVAAEGVYWAGVAAYRREKAGLEVLERYWEELRERFPGSRWWTHADVFE